MQLRISTCFSMQLHVQHVFIFPTLICIMNLCMSKSSQFSFAGSCCFLYIHQFSYVFWYCVCANILSVHLHLTNINIYVWNCLYQRVLSSILVLPVCDVNNNFPMYVDIVHVLVKKLLFSLIWPILSCVYHDIVKVSIVAVFDYFLCFNWNELPFLAVTDKLYKQVNKLILPSKSVW